MPGFYERSTFLSRKKERFTSFDSLKTYLTAQGSTFGRAIPLYSIGSDGNDSNIIGHWGYDSNGIIVPMGVIRFDRITDGGHAVIASVTNGTTAVVKTDPVSTLASSGQALAFDLSAGTNLYSGINFSIDGTNLTLPDTTGLAVGDIIYAQGRSEFTWGSGSAFYPRANCTSFISGSSKGLYISGSNYLTSTISTNCIYQALSSSFYSYNLEQEGSFIGIGWTSNVLTYARVCGVGRSTGIKSARAYSTGPTFTIGGSVENLSTNGIFACAAGRPREDGVIVYVGGSNDAIKSPYAFQTNNLETNLFYPGAPSVWITFFSTEPTIFKLLMC